MTKLRLIVLSVAALLLAGISFKAATSTQVFHRFSSSSTSPSTAATQPSPHVSPTPVTADTLREQVSPAVVSVLGMQEMGSGCIVRPNGVIVTSRHVVQGATQVAIKTADGKVHQGKVIDMDLRHDLALVRLEEPSTQFPTVTLAAAVKLNAGDTVHAIGSPKGQAGTITTGTFTRLTPQGSLQTSRGLLEPGNSGGPLLNAEGEVVGINKGLLDDKSGLATSVTAAKSLLERYEQIYER